MQFLFLRPTPDPWPEVLVWSISVYHVSSMPGHTMVSLGEGEEGWKKQEEEGKKGNRIFSEKGGRRKKKEEGKKRKRGQQRRCTWWHAAMGEVNHKPSTSIIY